MSKKLELSQFPSWPRLLNLKEASAYCGMSAITFKHHFSASLKPIGSKNLYDRYRIDEIIDGNLDQQNDWTAKYDF